MRVTSHAASSIGAQRLLILLSLLAPASSAAPALLDQQVGALPAGVELRDRLASLQQAGLGDLLLDRRVDPHTELGGSQPGALGDALRTPLAAHGLGVTEVGGLLYVGPAEEVANLRTQAALAQQRLSKFDAASRAAMRRVDSLSWPRLTEPRELIESLLAGHGLRLANPDRLPHDVWPAGRLPAMPLSDRLTLLLAGFDLAWAPTSERGVVQLVPAERRPTLTKSYRVRGRGRWAPEAFQAAFPAAEVEQRGATLELTGRVEAHEGLAAMLRGDRPAPPRSESPAGEQRLTLAVRSQPARAVLEKIATALKLSLEYDESQRRKLLESLDQRIDLSVSQATPAELLAEIARQAGVSIKLEGSAVRVSLAGE